MSLIERIAKADAERKAPRCILCGFPDKGHTDTHAFRAERPVRFPARDLTGWSKAA